MTVISSFVTQYYDVPLSNVVFVIWVHFGMMFKEFLQKYQNIVNMVMILFLIHSAITASGVAELIKR
jgi:threonine/homoserine/homoserine lactone efflux protein